MRAPFARRPPGRSVALATGAAITAAVAAGAFGVTPLAVGVAGTFVLVIGVARSVGRAVTAGAVLLATAGLVAGVGGAPELAVLGTLAAAVVAWDAGWTAVDLGAQLGEEARIGRALGLHTGLTATVGLLTVLTGVALFNVATGGQPMAALLFLLVAAVLVTVALD